MRKIAWACTLVTVLLMTSGCGGLNRLFHKTSYLEVVEERLGLSLDEAKVLEEWNTHGGFHGDGEAFLKLAVADGFEANLGTDWKTLPLKDAAYQYFYEWGGVFEHPETGERVIPEISNGYWYYTATGAMNWDFAILDIDENILYFYEWDA